MDKDLIDRTIHFVKSELRDSESGHDWMHIERVYNNTLKILETEKADTLVCRLGALLHDIADAKFNGGDDTNGVLMATKFLREQNISDEIISQVSFIIKYISFKGGLNENITKTKELMVVQDADRLDAIGAIGIARAFNYGGYKNRKIYDPGVKIHSYKSSNEYYSSTAPTIQHFYEKLLLLKDMMNTPSAKKMAEDRHRFMELFLEQFYKEVNQKP